VNNMFKLTPELEAQVTPLLTTITINPGELSWQVAAATAALLEHAARFPIYQRSGKLVRPIIEELDASKGRKTKVCQLIPYDGTHLRLILSRVAGWERFNKREKEMIAIDPPMDIAQSILSAVGEWPFPAVRGIISTPTIRPDGSLLTEPGFDKATGLLLIEPPPMAPLIVKPTKDDAIASLVILKDLLSEFPFVNDVSRAVALSGLITPVVRGAFANTPMHCANAATPGTGKSYLWDTAAAIVIGQPMPVLSGGESRAELEKRIAAALFKAQQLVSLDNLNGELNSEFLCQVIERPNVETRELGKTFNFPVNTRGNSMFATGNNLTLVEDLCRRAITSHLDAGVERPELRQFNRDPLAMVLADRGKYISAALTICSAYLCAGSPGPRPRLASFEGWSDCVRSALTWLGEEDPVKSMDLAREEDPTRVEHQTMLEEWSRVIGIGSENRKRLEHVLLQALSKSRKSAGDDIEPEHPDFYNALLDITYRKHDKRTEPDARTLADWLRAKKGRIVAGKRFMYVKDGRHAEWWVEECK
jgi:hypothetical protein